jgi:2,4-dienoyl-CoA reductase-like NADH-dependent reductase (Old Yellow Enzyme family)
MTNGAFIELAGEIKKQVEIPVIAVGGIRRLEQAERVLERNLADMVAIGRGLIADPELVRKSLAGKPEDVVECTDCQACFEFFEPDCEVPGLACSVNPSL